MFIMAHIIYCVNIGQYIKFVLSSKDWKKATGKDGKLIKHESSAAHQTATDMYFSRTSAASSSVARGSSERKRRRLKTDKFYQQLQILSVFLRGRTYHSEVIASIVTLITEGTFWRWSTSWLTTTHC